MPGHSKIDCGGAGNQCDPAHDDPAICGNDGCLHAAVGRPTQAPILDPPPEARDLKPLPGRPYNACGGPWYQCSKGEFGCGNDGCSDIKLSRPFNHPVPIPTGLIITPIPGKSADLCGGRYYQCVKGTPDCAADGCNDKLLGRGKYSNDYLLLTPSPKPNAPTVIPTGTITGTGCDQTEKPRLDTNNSCLSCLWSGNKWVWTGIDKSFCKNLPTFTPAGPTPTLIVGISTPTPIEWMGPCDPDIYTKHYWNSERCMSCNTDRKWVIDAYNQCPDRLIPTPASPTPTLSSTLQPPTFPTQSGWFCKSDVGTSDNAFICSGIPPTCQLCFEGTCKYNGFLSAVCSTTTSQTTSTKNALNIPFMPEPKFASAKSWGQVQALAVAGKVRADQISLWVYEAAKTYYPGIKHKFCRAELGECDFKL